MSRRVLLTAAISGAALSLPGVALATPTRSHVRVAPTAIRVRTNVVLRFRQPDTTGVRDGERFTETVRVNGPSRSGCVGAGSVGVGDADAGTAMRVTLRPYRLGGRWCTGLYRGRVQIVTGPSCPVGGPPHACPMWLSAPRFVAGYDFRFRVTR